jgi:hypothetical protein
MILVSSLLFSLCFCDIGLKDHPNKTSAGFPLNFGYMMKMNLPYAIIECRIMQVQNSNNKPIIATDLHQQDFGHSSLACGGCVM